MNDTYTIEQKRVVESTEAFVREKLCKDSSGHDWWHIHRVRNNALHIGRMEGADLFVVELSALLHDIADYKFNGGDLEEGPRVARQWLQSLDVDEQVIQQVCDTIATLSFKGAGVKSEVSSAEGKIVQDADRLDAIGAIGIARTFAYGGYKGRLMHDPEVKPESHETFEQYKNSTGPTINHFYEKLLLLKDLLNTKSARQIAEHRHQYMQEFLSEFLDEWDGMK